jgi:hypothetical protein
MAKSISKELSSQQELWIKENNFLSERVNAGIDVHPSESDVKMLQEIAHIFAPKLDVHVKGCQDCVNKLVKFVFEKINDNAKA